MLKISKVMKSFPGVIALDNVSLQFNSGEIHALLGENGAGKSTLIKVICGIYKADSGQVFIDGQLTNFKHVSDALKQGIAIVNQEIQVIPESTVAENIMLDKLEQYRRMGFIDWKSLERDASISLQRVGLDINPKTKIGGLSVAQKQLVQIAKALALKARILILDEPTSTLTQKEINSLFAILKDLKRDGVTIIFVSHKLEEVLELCDKLSVLRDGKYIGTKSCIDMTKQKIIKMMIGRETNDAFRGFLNVEKKNIVLEMRNIVKKNQFKGTSLKLRQGEILGLYGLVGSGRTELAKILIGAHSRDEGKIIINGQEAEINSVCDSFEKYRIGYVSENRKEEGLILQETIKTNIGITIWKNLRNRLSRFINLKKETTTVEKEINRLSVKATSVNQVVNNLSGGNQQKISIGKWLAAECDILVIDEPTVGVDVGAKEYIYDIIWNLAKNEGKSIILISSDMPELIHLSRRILVFKEFSIVGEIDGLNDSEYDSQDISRRIGQFLT